MSAIVVDARFAGGPLLVEAEQSPWDPATQLVVLSGPGFALQLFAHEARALAEALLSHAPLDEATDSDGLVELKPIENAADPRWRKLAAWLERNPRPVEDPVGIEDLMPSERAVWYEIHVRGQRQVGLSLVDRLPNDTDLETHIQRLVDEAPELSAAQREHLASQFHSEPVAPVRVLRRDLGAVDHLTDLEG